MSIALFTDDKRMINVLTYFFKDTPFVLHSKNDLDYILEMNCSHIILGVVTIEPDDWKRLKLAISLGKETYLMIRDPIPIAEARLAREIGVRDILIDPISRLVKNVTNTPDQLFPLLTYSSEDLGDMQELIYVGSETYFHPKQYWVKYGSIKKELSEKEAALLLFFLQHEGVLVTKHALAEQLWGGFIQADGISKVIARMKNKLGPARELIYARRLGGFMYISDRSILKI